jgi:hypothetical protein
VTRAKLDVARAVATGLAFVALAGADAVQSGVWSGDRLSWHPRRSGSGRIDDLDRWWASFGPRVRSDLVAAVRRVRPELPKRGLTILISDLWSDEAEGGRRRAGRHGTGDPRRAGPRGRGGPSRALHGRLAPHGRRRVRRRGRRGRSGAAQIDRYRALLGTWTDELRQRASVVHGAASCASSNDESAEHVFLRTLPAVGVLR